MSELLWSRVHDLLDERIDPLSDPVVVDACATDPEFAARLADLVTAIGGLDGLPVEIATSQSPSDELAAERTRSPVAGRLGLVAVLLVGAWLGLDRPWLVSDPSSPEPGATQAVVVPPRYELRPARLVDAVARSESWSAGRIRIGRRDVDSAMGNDATEYWSEVPSALPLPNGSNPRGLQVSVRSTFRNDPSR